MEFKQSDDEDRVMSRQLYRAGQAKPDSKETAQAPASKSSPAAKKSAGPASRPSSKSSNDKQSKGPNILLMLLLLVVGYYLLFGTPPQRKKAFKSLGVMAWLLFVGTLSYFFFLPDLAAMNQERRAIFRDPNLTFEQKFEKMREMDAKLTPAQRKQMGELMRKEFEHKRNADMVHFLKMTPEERVAYLKKRDEEWQQRRKEWEQRRQQFAKAGGNKQGNGGPGGNRGNGGPGGNRGNGGPGGGGPPGGGGGGQAGGAAREMSRLDSSSPESRAGSMYQRALMAQMGLGGGGRGFGGGPGGGGGGGRGGPGGGGGGGGGGGKR
jgi:uncharacterized membrane protein YgcG